MSEFVSIVCGQCKTAPVLVENADGETEAVCGRCGQRDEAQDALRIAAEQFAESAAIVLQSNLAKSTRGDKFMKFEAKPLRKRTFRWHAV